MFEFIDFNIPLPNNKWITIRSKSIQSALEFCDKENIKIDYDKMNFIFNCEFASIEIKQ